MFNILKVKKARTTRRIYRVRRVVSGTESIPRLAVKIQNRNFWAQVINDQKRHTIFGSSSMHFLKKQQQKTKTKQKIAYGNREAVKLFAEYFGKQLVKLNVKSLVFDRHGHTYNSKRKILGKIELFANLVRKYVIF